MKKIMLYICIVLVLGGFIARNYAARYSHVTPEGMLVDSAWLPVGTLMLLVGILVLIVLGIQFILGYIKGQRKK